MKAFFLSRNQREKYLLLAFVVLITLFWGNHFLGRVGSFRSRFAETRGELARQDQWLGSRESIEANAAKAIATLEPSKTLDSSKLLAEVNRIATEAGITTNVQADDTKNETTALFALHSLRFTMRKVDYPSLIRFYVALQQRSPYIGLEQFSLRMDNPANPAQLTATFRLSSVEVIRR